MMLNTFPPLFTIDDLEHAYMSLFKSRKKLSHNSDIWNFRREWDQIKHTILSQLNDGSYQFDALERYEINGEFISQWSSRDMIALKLIARGLEHHMSPHLPKTCYHTKGHGGLKKAACDTAIVIPDYHYVFRSDIKSYYESINFDCLLKIIGTYVKNPILLILTDKACRRTETRGGNYYEYLDFSLPKGSALSPILGCIALIPLDQAMARIKNIHYARFMDDWVVLTKSKTALRKVIKRTYEILDALHFKLHPLKTYTGKISHGFNFLGFYFDDKKMLPSQEVIRRVHERSNALYERPQEDPSRRSNIHKRDISLYPVHESAPTDDMVQDICDALRDCVSDKRAGPLRMRCYIEKWLIWLRSGMSTLGNYVASLRDFLPTLFQNWVGGTQNKHLTQ